MRRGANVPSPYVQRHVKAWHLTPSPEGGGFDHPLCGCEPTSLLQGDLKREVQRKLAAALCAVALSFGCGTLANAADAPPGASSCSGCHPTSARVDTPVPRLIGRDPAAMVAAMQAFRSGARPTTVMDRIAKGFNDDEIKAIATWYAAQR